MAGHRPKLFLIDASSFIFRAFYAIRKLTTSQGLPTNATFGFVTMLLKVLEQYRPDYVSCVFDTPGPSFRKEMYGDYKSNRGAPPDDLLPQFECIHRAVEVLGLHKIAEPGFEADDVIATLATRFQDCDVTIVSTDKDLMQLVDGRVVMLDTMKDVLYTPKEVREKLGVGPELVPDYLGLIGDSSDNIPGVPGIGPKGAVELIAAHGPLENILRSAELMKPGKKRDALIENAALARLSKELATVKKDMDGRVAAITLESMRRPEKVGADFIQWAKGLEFSGLVRKYSPDVAAVASSGADLSVHVIESRRAWKELLSRLEREPRLAFDTETRGEKTREIEIVGLSLACDKKEAFYVPLRHAGFDADLVVNEVLEDFRRLAERKTVIAQNLKYDYKVLLAEGQPSLKASFFDTMLAHYLLEPEEKHGLDSLAMKYLSASIGDFKQTLGERENFSLVPVSDAAKYAGLDAWSTFCLAEILEKKLRERGLDKLFNEVEMPLAPILAEMEWDGIAIDTQVLSQLSNEYSGELSRIEARIFSSVGETFNLNSPKQLSEILFAKLKLPVVSKTKTGFSTDVSVLEKLAPLHPVPEMLLEYRELSKLKNTYIDVIPGLVEKDGRVHAQFNQAVTATGRLSSSNPNLQNIPVKTERGRKIRKAFVAAPGNVLVGADYSQVELRLVAHLSGDKALIDAFRSGLDVHRATAAEIFGAKPEDVTEEQRSAAKAINFGLIYGKTAFGLSQELRISRASAAQYIEAYFQRYQGVKRYMDRCLEEARKNHEAGTLLGRKRPLKDIENKNAAVRANAERMAMNTPVQGTAADLMKLAMVKVCAKTRQLGAKMVLQVHDELVLDAPAAAAQEVEHALRQEMEHVTALDVPLAVNTGIGKNWFEI